MLKEYLEVFEKWIAKKGVKVITDAYIPKNGVYRLIQITDSGFEILSTLEISYDKKNDYVSGSEHMDYPFIVELDYYSKLLEMNKPIDSSKTIHANNYFSFAVRNENIQNIDVALASFVSILFMCINAGTSIIPPPAPNSPLTIPDMNPIILFFMLLFL